MKIITKKKFLLTLAVLVFAFSLGVFVKTQAAPVTGWLWGGSEDGTIGGKPNVIDGDETGVGWINANCASQVDSNGDGTADATLSVCNGGTDQWQWCNRPGFTCAGGASCVPACSLENYNLDIPTTNNSNLSGYIWSENLGWISFQESSGFPSVASGDDYAYQPRRVDVGGGEYEIRGWARIMSIPQTEAALPGNAGGWSGWVRLHSDPDDPVAYGLRVKSDGTMTKGATTSYAWSNELGWIDFSGINAGASNFLTTVINSVGTGTGTITSSPAGINCGSDCSELYPSSTSVILTATATVGNFTGWDDPGCPGTGTCTVTMDAAKTVTATFSSIVIPPPTCPDGTCNGTEDCSSCPADCGACPSDTNWKEVAP